MSWLGVSKRVAEKDRRWRVEVTVMWLLVGVFVRLTGDNVEETCLGELRVAGPTVTENVAVTVIGRVNDTSDENVMRDIEDDVEGLGEMERLPLGVVDGLTDRVTVVKDGVPELESVEERDSLRDSDDCVIVEVGL